MDEQITSQHTTTRGLDCLSSSLHCMKSSPYSKHSDLNENHCPPSSGSPHLQSPSFVVDTPPPLYPRRVGINSAPRTDAEHLRSSQAQVHRGSVDRSRLTRVVDGSAADALLELRLPAIASRCQTVVTPRREASVGSSVSNGRRPVQRRDASESERRTESSRRLAPALNQSPASSHCHSTDFRNVNGILRNGSEIINGGRLDETIEIQNNMENLSIDEARRRESKLAAPQMNSGCMVSSLDARQLTSTRSVNSPRNLQSFNASDRVAARTMEIRDRPGISNLQLVVPTDSMPLRGLQHSDTQQLETHVLINRVVGAKVNEYVDEPSIAVTKSSNSSPNGLSATSAMLPTYRSGCHDIVMQQPTTAKDNMTKSKPCRNSGIKPVHTAAVPDVAAAAEDDHVRLVCAECERCKCAHCTGTSSSAAALPSCWIAGGRYECGAWTCIDRMSCVCCVRTVFYHCLYNEDDDVDIVAKPFSCCEGPHCCARWTLIGAMLPFMPCLLLYAPLQCAVRGVARCRGACLRKRRRGCRCNDSRDVAPVKHSQDALSSSSATATSSSATTRSLLDSAENSSS